MLFITSRSQHLLLFPVSNAIRPLAIISGWLISILDSLEAHYQYFKDVLDQVKGKENEMNAELSSMEKSYQKKISEWQKKATDHVAD